MDLQTRICSWFGRRLTTKWTAQELRAFKNARGTPEDDVTLLERYYTAKIGSEMDYRRRTILSLLRHWPGEIDRARLFLNEADKKRQKIFSIPTIESEPSEMEWQKRQAKIKALKNKLQQ